MPSRRWLLLTLLLFLATLLWRLPARWALTALPASVNCDQPGGSIWRGSCGTLHADAQQLAGFGWRLHPLRLLRGELSATLSSRDPRARGTLQLTRLRDGRLRAESVVLDLPLDGGLIPGLPAGWTGQLQLQLQSLELRSLQIESVLGTIMAHDLVQRRPQLTLGSYELRFAAPPATDGTINGQLRDVGGPLAFEGRMQLRRGREFELNGNVAARSDAEPILLRVLEQLGPADSNGRRPLSVAGRY